MQQTPLDENERPVKAVSTVAAVQLTNNRQQMTIQSPRRSKTKRRSQKPQSSAIIFLPCNQNNGRSTPAQVPHFNLSIQIEEQFTADLDV
ncbi:unnamed protein product [Phytophthora lilii]|uniref:Unnamed protein product n=1 Tax=Phytophthora lilii TaxID=2077276 RepID=A0A9W6TN33_9STRA|nr:unnamed protein product [Phytophthora lilii]